MTAARVFPEPCPQRLRDRVIPVLGVVPADAYGGMGCGLERWSATERLGLPQCRILMIAADHDFIPLAGKRSHALRIGARRLVLRGSRHGTPFDLIVLASAALLSALTDRPPSQPESGTREEIHEAPDRSFMGNLADAQASVVI